MTTDHGITLDEQIEAVREIAVDDLGMARRVRFGECGPHVAFCVEMERKCREEAAALLAIENTLRAIRDRQRPAQD